MGRLFLVALGLCLASGPGNALSSDRSLDQLHHTAWTLRDGAPGNIRALAQTKNGFLWLGSSTGLYRFDGIRFHRIVPEHDDPKRSLQVTALLAANNGEIWVGYDFGGIAVYRNGHLRAANPWPPKGGVASIVQARDGAIWIASEARGAMQLARYQAGHWTRFDSKKGLVDGLMGPVLPVSDGTVYVALPPALLRLAPSGSYFQRDMGTVGSFAAFAEGRDGVVWLADDSGLRRLDRTGVQARLAHLGTPYVTRHILVDRDSGIWVTGQDDGLVRYRYSGEKLVGETATGMSAKLSLSVLEDREGNVWVGTASGLDRFAPTTMVLAKDAPAPVTGFVSGPASPHVFFAGPAGVYRIGRGDTVARLIFSKKNIGVLCGSPDRMLAISLEGAFLLELKGNGALKRVREVNGPLSVTCAQDAEGNFWTGMDRLYRVENGLLTEAGKPGGTITMLRQAPKDGLFAARSRVGLLEFKALGTRILVPSASLAIGSITTLAQVREGLLVGGQKGLALVSKDRVFQLSERDYPFLAGMTGILRTPDGWIWMIGSSGIVRVKTQALAQAFRKPGTPVPFQRIGEDSDYRGRSNIFEANDIARDSSGTLWFATDGGVAWVDPSSIVRNRVVPPVAILSMSADGTKYPLSGAPRHLTPNVGRIEIQYTALSLTDATANRFRYRLIGGQGGWYEAGPERQALFTNLGPGPYEFQVVAANNAGIWNSEGAKLRFIIAPAFYQALWFYFVCAAIVLALAWFLYRRRLSIITERARSRVEAQLAERERIARELHDTLLQGFQGLMLRFQTVVELLPRGERSRLEMESALDRAESMLIEGRDRVHSIRQDLRPVELSDRLSVLADDMLPSSIEWRLETFGTPRLVCAPVAEEIASIVREALSNAVRHAKAASIVLLVRYRTTHVMVVVEDDGVGMPLEILAAGGREGHYGLIGMRERAGRLSGSLNISVSSNGGTAISLTIPANIAYESK
ncbi:Signal transduction histidine kinase [Novosphingobium mathurense]|uniref:Signal transduction histidine kinase n=1 Tax=Novosphingobium mathurense TaxID=428990 RepID=A0A1U6HUI4_9SPHN|nr:Signal transduction histidine kinase [Novosphingobium mathurense]